MIQKDLGSLSLNGREFTAGDFKLIKDTVLLCPHLSRTELSKTISENLQWYQSNGEPKYQACLRVLERLDDWGHIKLPPIDHRARGGPQKIERTSKSEAGNLFSGYIDEQSSVFIESVRDRKEAELWNEYIQRYHYMGYKKTFGCRQKYFIRFADGEIVGCFMYSASAWSLSCRDKWIGWDKKQRSKYLHLIINNSRLLIFPWIKIKNLASKVLSIAAKEVPRDWQKRYSYRPVLMETFVDRDRFRGTSYRAANWRYLGMTKGRGRMDRYTKYLSTVKDVYVYPLSPSFREELKGGEE